MTEGRKLTFTAQETGDYYVYVTKKVKEVTAVIGEQTVSFDNVDRGYFMELGRINKDVEVRLETGDDGSRPCRAEVWRFNSPGPGSRLRKNEPESHGAFQVDGYGIVRQHHR